MDLRRTFILLACVVLFVPLVFSNFTYEKFETVKIVLFSILVGAALFSKKTIVIGKPLAIGLGFFLLFGLVCTMFSPDKYYSFFGRNYIWMGFYFFIVWSLFLILLVSEMSREKLLTLLKIVVVVGLLNSIWSIFQTFGFGSKDVYLMGFLVRSTGFLGNPNFTAMFLACSVIFAVYFWAESKDYKAKLAYGINTFVLIWGIMFLASRGAILGLAASLAAALYMSLLSKNWRFSRYIVFGLLLSLTLYVLFTPLVRGDEFATPYISEQNIVQRVETWSSALALASKHPFTGVGWGNYDEVHNVFLNFLVIGGIPLLLSFVGLFGWMLWSVRRQFLPQAEDSLLDQVLLSSLAGFVVSACFNPVSSAVWLLPAVIFAGLLRTTSFSKNLNLKIGTPIGAILFLLGLIFLLNQCLLFFGLKAEDRHQYNQAQKFLNWSLKIDPNDGQAQSNLARTEAALGTNNQQAEADTEKIIRLHPGNASGYVQAGAVFHQLFTKTGNENYYQKSLENLKIGTNLNPYNNGGFLAAEYGYEKGDYQAAMDFLNFGLTNKPDAETWLLLANIYVKTGNDKAAADALLRAYKVVLSNYRLELEQYSLKHLIIAQKQGKKLNSIPMNSGSESDLFY
jgi:O-antigen ligase/Tfp pilus assembly protein PilF